MKHTTLLVLSTLTLGLGYLIKYQNPPKSLDGNRRVACALRCTFSYREMKDLRINAEAETTKATDACPRSITVEGVGGIVKEMNWGYAGFPDSKTVAQFSKSEGANCIYDLAFPRYRMDPIKVICPSS